MPYSGLKHSRNAYSGLVPISPYTTPSAVIDKTASRRPVGFASTVGRSGGMGRAAATPICGVRFAALEPSGLVGSDGMVYERRVADCPRPVIEPSAWLPAGLFRRDERFQVGRCALENFHHFRHIGRVGRAMHRNVHVRPPEHRHRFVRRAHLFTEDRGADLGEPVDDLVDGALVLGEVLPSGVGDRVDLLAAFLDRGAREAHVLEHRERRVDRTRARRVATAGALLQLLDDLVPVPRFLVEHAKDHELQATLLEHATAAPRTAAPVAASEKERAEVRVSAPIPSAPGTLTIAWPAVTMKHAKSSKFDIAVILRSIYRTFKWSIAQDPFAR